MAALYSRWSCWQYYLLKLIEPHEDRWEKLFAASEYLKKRVYQNALKNYIKLKTFEIQNGYYVNENAYYFVNENSYNYYHPNEDENMCYNKVFDFHHYYRIDLLYKFRDICSEIQNSTRNCIPNDVRYVIIKEEFYENHAKNFLKILYTYFVKILSFLYWLQRKGQYLHYQNEMVMNDMMVLFKNSGLFHMCWLMQRLLMYYPSTLRKTPESLLILSARSIYCRGGTPLWQLRYTMDILHMPSKLRTVEHKWTDDEHLNEFIKHYEKQMSHFTILPFTRFEPSLSHIYIANITRQYFKNKFCCGKDNVCADEISFMNKYRLN
ncbi:hypothetical protein [Choristoneura diversana nucleopolyhedrovirus]|nr:hypothetical protein [Choristoneura diversana nucleopolyhedrovirus]